MDSLEIHLPLQNIIPKPVDKQTVMSVGTYKQKKLVIQVHVKLNFIVETYKRGELKILKNMRQAESTRRRNITNEARLALPLINRVPE